MVLQSGTVPSPRTDGQIWQQVLPATSEEGSPFLRECAGCGQMATHQVSVRWTPTEVLPESLNWMRADQCIGCGHTTERPASTSDIVDIVKDSLGWLPVPDSAGIQEGRIQPKRLQLREAVPCGWCRKTAKVMAAAALSPNRWLMIGVCGSCGHTTEAREVGREGLAAYEIPGGGWAPR